MQKVTHVFRTYFHYLNYIFTYSPLLQPLSANLHTFEIMWRESSKACAKPQHVPSGLSSTCLLRKKVLSFLFLLSKKQVPDLISWWNWLCQYANIRILLLLDGAALPQCEETCEQALQVGGAYPHGEECLLSVIWIKSPFSSLVTTTLVTTQWWIFGLSVMLIMLACHPHSQTKVKQWLTYLYV